MGFWDAYFRSLKPLEVEEPIDVWVHRPPAYVLAKILLPTPVSPNLVTLGSISASFAAGACIFASFPYHLPLAGVLIFSSAVLDCCDGQLARLRKTSSVFGRMLDGVADSVGSAVVVGGGAWLIYQKFQDPLWLCVVAVTLALITIVTGSFHTSSYDHFKNVFLRLTHPSYREGEELSVAEARFAAQRPQMSLFMRFAWAIYFIYLRGQTNYIDKFDPLSRRFAAAAPDFSERDAAIYRKYAGAVMRWWRTLFGFGSLVFGLAVSIGLDVVEYYLLFRLVLLNGIFYGYLRPKQREATRRAYEEIIGPV